VALFGPTDPNRHIPPATDLQVIRKNLACSPCYKAHCSIFTHVCMNDVLPDEVFECVEELLKAKKQI
jgi:heptosyltransferase-2